MRRMVSIKTECNEPGCDKPADWAIVFFPTGHRRIVVSFCAEHYIEYQEAVHGDP